MKKNKDISTKRGISLLIGIFIFTMILIVSNLDKETVDDYSDITKYTKIAAIKDYENALNTEDLKIFYLGSPTCGYCELFQPTLFEVADKNDLEIYYIDVSSVPSIDIILSSHEELENFGTPTTVIIDNGEVTDVLIGKVEKEILEGFFDDNNLLKGDN